MKVQPYRGGGVTKRQLFSFGGWAWRAEGQLILLPLWDEWNGGHTWMVPTLFVFFSSSSFIHPFPFFLCHSFFSFIYSTNIYCFTIVSHFIFTSSAKLVPWDFPCPSSDSLFHSACHYLQPFFCLFVYFSVCLYIVKFKLYGEDKFCAVPCSVSQT